jgi:hypothetical protein
LNRLCAGGMQPGEKRRALIPPTAGYVRKGMGRAACSLSRRPLVRPERVNQ